MKKQLLLSLIFTLFCGIIYGQHLIRVNNDPAADADYTTIQAANDDALPGDTIYVEGSPAIYSGADIDKKLTIIGPGYFLADNDSTQANVLDAEISGVLDFITGSKGSKVCGLILSTLYIRDDEIVASRCKISGIGFWNNSNNTLITQNFIIGQITVYSGNLTNSIFSNNIIGNGIGASSTSYPLQITNNVFIGSGGPPVSVYYSTISNNIFISSTNKLAELTGNTTINNIFAYAGTNANGNKYSITMTTVFVDLNGTLGYSQDERYKLKASSPAIGAGVSGVDCGAFGGVTPYVLSGLPPFPRIYEATIPGTAYSDKGLSCNIKIKAGK